MTETSTTQLTIRRPRRMAREPDGNASDISHTGNALTARTAAVRPQTKAAQVAELLVRCEGASLDELCNATNWLPHTCRAFLTGLRKKGKLLERSKREDGATVYKFLPAAIAA